MALGGVAGGGEGKNVAVVVQGNGIEVGVDAADKIAVALGGDRAQVGEEGRGRFAGRGGDGDAHVIGDAGLAGRVHDVLAELGNIDARFEAGAGLEVERLCGLEELGQAVEGIEVYQTRGRPTRGAAEPGEAGGGEAVGVVGEEAVAVEVEVRAGGRENDLVALDGRDVTRPTRRLGPSRSKLSSSLSRRATATDWDMGDSV